MTYSSEVDHDRSCGQGCILLIRLGKRNLRDDKIAGMRQNAVLKPAHRSTIARKSWLEHSGPHLSIGVNLLNSKVSSKNGTAIIRPLKDGTLQIHHTGQSLLLENVRQPRGAKTDRTIKNRTGR